MRIALLGGTGRTGHLLLKTLLERGHSVRVLVRDPTKLGGIAGRVDAVVGESTDPEAVDRLLDWTLVRPPRLQDGPATGRIAHHATVPGRSTSLRRADLASFLADVTEQHLYPRQAPFVSSA